MIRDLDDLQVAVSKVEDISVIDYLDRIISGKINACEAGERPCHERDRFLCHEGTVKVGIVCRMVKMIVGIDDIAQRLFCQILAHPADVSGAIAAVEQDRFVVALNEVIIIAVAQQLPCARSDTLKLKIRLVHWTAGAVFVLDPYIMKRRKIDQIYCHFYFLS